MRRVIPMLVILLAGQAMASMDAAIMIVASPSLRADLHTSPAQMQLIVAMYTMSFGALVVTGARLGDVLGRGRAFLSGLAAFTVASLAAGLAPTPDALIGARAIQGAAAALMTPQVLSIIQLRFHGEIRTRAVGAYSMVLAAGVAAGQVVGGLLVSAHLLAAAWRPALLLNAPVGVLVLLGARRYLPEIERGAQRRLDLLGAGVLSVALLALVVPLTFGRDAGWPAWTWPCLTLCALALTGFVAFERRLARRGGDPLFDLDVLVLPRVAAGVGAVLLLMACYAGFLVSLTLHLQGGLGFSALSAGLIFAVYAGGFASASLTWTRLGAAGRKRLPVVGPIAMAASLVAVGVIARGGWSVWPTAPLLFCAGAGQACGFSPLASRLTTLVGAHQAADLSGLVLTSSLVGQVIGIAGFVGVYLSAAPDGSARALELTTVVVAGVLVLATALAARSLVPQPARPVARRPCPDRLGSAVEG
jgi:MFS family permease